MPLAAMFIGDREFPEFGEALAALAAQTNLCTVPDCRAALDRLTQPENAVDLVVLAERRPGEFAAAQLDRLRRAAPLARCVSLLGSWCEGETRSGAPLPGALRLYWHQFPARFARELARAAAGECPTWGLPTTTSDDERLLAQATRQCPTGRDGLIVVCARHREMGDLLLCALGGAGYRGIALGPGQVARVERATSAIWAPGEFDAAARQECKRLRVSIGNVPLIALLDFPRAEDSAAAQAAGASHILSLPFEIRDLLWLLEET